VRGVTIRPARKADAELLALLGHEFTQYLRELGDQNPGYLTAADYRRDAFSRNPAFAGLVAEIDGEPVGYVLYHQGYDLDRGGRILYVFDLFVRNVARGRGVGRTLMLATLDVCRRTGGHAVVFNVWEPNTKARTFYERLGAKPVRELHAMYLPVTGNCPSTRTPLSQRCP
jgi:GNAT superfamily N-acetyltransferase